MQIDVMTEVMTDEERTLFFEIMSMVMDLNLYKKYEARGWLKATRDMCFERSMKKKGA